MSKFLIVYYNDSNSHVVDSIKTSLDRENIDYLILERTLLRPSIIEGMDFVIVVGGDGTFLRTSHFIRCQVPILGVNSNPKTKEGFFMQAKAPEFDRYLMDIISEDYRIMRLNRLQATINGKPVDDPALNDYYIGKKESYKLYNYDLEVDGKKEFQRSSGVIVGTAAGSHAWLSSAGGKKMSIASDKFQYIARELYRGNLIEGYGLKRGILGRDGVIRITQRSDEGILVADSVSSEYPLKEGDVVEIRVSDCPLSYLKF